ncbi:MAG: hypothetical protein ACRDGE_02960, partial [Candidatus Limnocylindria bacterium]
PPPPPPPPPPEAPPPGGRGRMLRIRVRSGDEQKVNIAIPLAIARLGKAKMAASGLVRAQLSKFGIDLDEVLRTADAAGHLVDITEGDERVEIFVE